MFLKIAKYKVHHRSINVLRMFVRGLYSIMYGGRAFGDASGTYR